LRSNPHQEVKSEISVSSVSPDLTELPVPEALISSEDEKLATLKHAIETGEIKLKVETVRKFMHCSQKRAMLLRRELLTHPKPLPVV
jgi:anti-sigma28 factor (negative regulator of flagellin synthesis)